MLFSSGLFSKFLIFWTSARKIKVLLFLSQYLKIVKKNSELIISIYAYIIEKTIA